jgi:hypothetical protein
MFIFAELHCGLYNVLSFAELNEFFTLKFQDNFVSRLMADWSVVNMNPDMTLNMMLLYVGVSSAQKKNKN